MFKTPNKPAFSPKCGQTRPAGAFSRHCDIPLRYYNAPVLIWFKTFHWYMTVRKSSSYSFFVFTFNCFSFFLRTSSHSLTMRPHKIHESSSRCERLEEAEELDTREEPLFLREPFTERRDLLSVSNNLQNKALPWREKIRLQWKRTMVFSWLFLRYWFSNMVTGLENTNKTAGAI